MTRYLFFMLVLFFCTPAVAADFAGTISKFEGKVTVFRNGGVRGEKLSMNDTPIHVGDSVKTKRTGRAFITMIDGSKIVLKENSLLVMKSINNPDVGTGTVLFEIKEQGRARGMHISAATVTMGVRGTKFAVSNDNDNVSIYLKSGELQITSLEGEFKRYRQAGQEEFAAMRKKMADDFENTLEKMETEFDANRREMAKSNFVLVKDFLMKTGSAVSITGNEVHDTVIPQNIDDALELLKTF